MDTIKLLIEADAAGLNSGLQKAGKTIQNFVSDMNSQTINWQAIMTDTLTPAIIAGIAGSFALALSQAIQFQSVMTQTANSSGTAMSTNMNQASGDVLNLASATGQSASDIAQALGGAVKAQGSYTAGLNEVTEASKIALATGMSLESLVGSITPALVEWGVAASQTGVETKQLFGAAAQGKVSISDLSEALAKNGAALANSKVSLNEASAAIEAMSNQAGMTGPAAIEVFNKIGAATTSIGDRATLSTVGVKNFFQTLQTQGIAGVMAQLETYFSSVSDSTAQIMGQNAGFTPSTIEHMRNAGLQAKDLVTSTAAIEANAQGITTNIDNNLGPMQKLKQFWEDILTSTNKYFEYLKTQPKSAVDLSGDVAVTKNSSFGLVGDAYDTVTKTLGNLLADAILSVSKGVSTNNAPGTNNSTINNTTIITSNALTAGKGPTGLSTSAAAKQGSYGYVGK